MRDFILFIALFISGFNAWADPRPIRILILNDVKELNISAFDTLKIEGDGISQMLIEGGSEARCKIYISDKGLVISGLKGSDGPIFIETSSGLPITVNGRSYRGKIEVRRQDGGINVINIVDLEEYLYGIIKMEISPDWSIEAVKAQAVVARTFAYFNIGRHKKDGYDLCNTYHCQVYGGISSEDGRSIEAVNATSQQILTYDGRVINAIYHSTCGGHTADPELVWPGARVEPLEGVSCPFCKQSPHYSWHYKIKLSKIASRLQEFGYDIGSIKGILISKKDAFGRVGELIIIDNKEEMRISANAFRMAIDPEKVRSTLFRLLRIGDDIIFEGLGWGHGVGMCQWGAKRMAELGFNFKEILEHYYPRTKLSLIENLKID